jgi:hypothetical protein
MQGRPKTTGGIGVRGVFVAGAAGLATGGVLFRRPDRLLQRRIRKG